jgi:hypothetical protein
MPKLYSSFHVLKVLYAHGSSLYHKREATLKSEGLAIRY